MSTDKELSGVVQTEVMAAPMLSEAYERRCYPELAEPEAVHARLWGDPDKKEYHLNYNGHDIIHINVKSQEQARVRCYSDGNFQSTPFVQQFQVQSLEKVQVEVSFMLPKEMICMRPERAADGRAILGQIGHPLIFGVNGLYILEWDLLISWHGYDFEWKDTVIREEHGLYTAALTTEAAMRPLMILLRPRYYSEHLGYKDFKPWKRRPNEKAAAGWCSWEAFHEDIMPEDLERTAQHLEPLRNFGLEYMQLDDGFEYALLPKDPNGTVTDAWINCNEKFPEGHEGIVRTIKQHGFAPGLWTAPNITNMVTAKNSGFCLQTPDGPLFGDWIRGVIDCEAETLEKQVTPCFEAFRKLGYEYIKIDGMRHLTYDGMHEAVRRGLMTGEDGFDRVKRYMEAARKGLGEEVYLLSCWGVITPAIGMADGMRVSTDAYPRWCAFSMQLQDTARWFFAQRVLFTLDPDHICVRADVEWARMMLSLVSLTGGLYMVSDAPEVYDETSMEMMKKTLPPLTTRAAETGPVDLTTPTSTRTFLGYDDQKLAYDITYIDPMEKSPFASLWAHHFEQNGRRWCVVQRSAIVPLNEEWIEVRDLALDPSKKYYAFDFWKQQPLGIIQDGIVMNALKLGETQVISLVDVSDGLPCLLASDRHVSMDLVSIKNTCREGDSLKMELCGWEGLTVNYTLYSGGKALKVDAISGAEVLVRNHKDTAVLCVRFTQPCACLAVGFEKEVQL